MADILFFRAYMKSEKIEGLVLSKLPHKERDLICHLLLRSGKKISVVFYGGQGGGRKQKSSVVELGHMLSVQLQRAKSQSQSLFHGKEYKPTWVHESIRLDHNKFYLMCFFLEIIEKLAVEDDLDEFDGDYQQGLFRILSNGIFQLEQSGSKFQKTKHLGLFLSKLIFELGLTPNLQTCLFSDKKLVELDAIQMVFEQGGFAHSSQFERLQQLDHKNVWQVMQEAWEMPYKELDRLAVDPGTPTTIMQYLLYQTGLTSDKLKTYSTIF